MNKILQGIFLLLMLALLPFGAIAGVSVSETHTNVSCYGGSDGAINITATGTGPFVYIWNDTLLVEDRANLAPGTYTVVVIDAAVTSDTLSVVITQPAIITTTKNITHVYCGGASTGAIDLTASGGNGGYTYAWSDFVYTEDRINIPAANYYYTVTDSKGCIRYDSANVTQPPGMVINKTVTNVTCGSGANGAINVTVQFGIPGYTYLWNDGVITEDRSGIAAGTYSLTVTDASGCSTSATATVGQSGGGMAVNTTSVNPGCNGGSNGTITVTSVIGSVGPYTFKWSDGPTTQNRTGMAAGSYTVTATSTTGCTAAATVNLSQPAVLAVTLTPIQLTCFGSNNGAINTTVSGGTPAFTYNWGGSVFTPNRTGLSTGTYTITVTDSKGCTATQSAFVPQPLQLSITTTPLPLACTAGPSGSITTTVTGGTTAYSYNWGSGIITPNLINVNAGTYTVTVTDAHGCTAVASGTILGYTPMALSYSQVNEVCYGDTIGSVNLSVSNGWVPYTYIWSNTATTQDINNLAAGSYTVTVTDNHSCTATRTATITQPSFPITINATVTDVTCNGLNNGSISITAANGVGAYTYNWGNGITTQNRTALAAGNYAVTVTDANGCSASSAFTVNQPAPVAITAAVTNATCYGSATGSISLSVTGGFAPYTYGWNGGSNAQVRNGLAAGTYTVTVTDNHSCQATASETITQQTAITIAATATNVTCNGLSNGAINTTVSGGAGAYSYDWGAGFNTPNRTNLSAGTYVLTVTDNLSCTASSSTTITQPAAISVSSVNTHVSCNGGNNGAITLAVSGGVTPYGYTWVGGAITPNRTNLTAGSYTVTVTDNNSCSALFTTTITQPAAIALSTSVTNVACNGGATGSISVSATGGTGAYSYSWSNGPATAINNNLTAGTYTVTVRDANLCSATASGTVTQPAAIATSIVSINITCNGQTNGSIDLTVTGGTGAYTYIWSNGPTTRDISSLAAGTYTVTVKDAANCQATASATITQPAAINLSTSTINGGCNGSASGSIDLTVSGGTTNYTYLWSNSALTQDIAGLAANTYSVTVTDANACQATTTATITQPAVLSVTETHTNILCNAATTGTITTTTTGGSTPYNYNWGNNITTPNRTGLAAGLYTVTVTDNVSCTATVSATITQPGAITLASTKTDVQCNASATGAIDLTVNGGAGTYGYHWSNNATSQDISGVTAGNYSVTVNDANACSASASATITQPSPITVSFTLTNVSCYGGSNGAVTTTISGGNGGYTYNWSNNTSNPAITNVPAGNYNLQIKDVTNCVANLSFNVTQPSQMVAAETHNSITCNGANNGTIDLSVSGGSPVYTYHWSNNAPTQDLTGLASGVYSVTITDAASCTATVNNINITEPAAITLSTVTTDVVCSGSGSGAVDLTVTGGTMPYSYHWNNNAFTQDLSGVGAGNYQVLVTDANSCQAQTAALVNQATGMQVTLATTPVNCFGATNGAVTTTVSGGSGSYIYNWSNNATSANLSNVAAAVYTVTVHDAQNCTGVATATVTQPAAINIAENHTNVTCNGSATGTINTTVSGGAGNYIYQWSNNAGTANLTNLAAATYTLTVTDANACSATKAVVIAQSTAIALTETHKPYACGNNAGAIDLTVAGGTQPYTYNWTGGLSTQDLNNLLAGNYQVTVTDAANCAANLSVAIAQLQPLSISVASTDVTCNGSNNGTLNVIALGGTAPYTYSWSNGATTASVANVSAAHYRILVTDANTCRAADSTTINQPAAIQVSTSVHDISCHGLADGSITVAVSGGAGGYSYNWNTTANTATISNLIGGNYLLTVTDSRGCTNTATNVPVSEPQPMAIASSVAAIGCAGHNDGQVMLQVSGGVQPYAYKWNNNSAAQNLQNIAAGNYDVTVTDSHGCEANGAYIIGQAPALVVTPAVVNTPCQSVSKGAISLAVNGGNPGYRYSWSNGNTTDAINNVAEGTYAVTITDARNCTVQQSFTIASDYVLEVNATESATIDLGETVQLTAVASTDHNNTYSWTAANSVLCNTCAATETSPMQNTEYLVTVIDANGCKATDALTITVNSAIDIFVPNAFSPNGDGNNDFFQLFGDLGTIAYLDMMVFNRWGEKVFESNNANFNWDGTYKGEVVPQGVFVYTGKIVFINGTSRQLKGSLTVIR